MQSSIHPASLQTGTDTSIEQLLITMEGSQKQAKKSLPVDVLNTAISTKNALFICSQIHVCAINSQALCRKYDLKPHTESVKLRAEKCFCSRMQMDDSYDYLLHNIYIYFVCIHYITEDVEYSDYNGNSESLLSR